MACGSVDDRPEVSESANEPQGLPVASPLVPAASSSLDTPDNLLLITLDTTRVDRIGCYGYSRATTPYLDALAARGTRFENAIAPVALTRPSHATMLTGLLPHRHGVWSNGPYRLDERDHRHIQRFRQAGFRTGGVIASFVLSGSFGLAHGFDLFDDRTREIAEGDPEKTAEEVIDGASSWLEGSLRPPFLLWLHFYDPHHPYEPPEPFRSRFAEDPYDGEIAYMDDEIGRFLEELDQRGWLEETLVVVVSDHGEGLGEHGETTHGFFLYDNTVRVPLIMAGPGVPEARAISQQVTLADLMPTLLEAFGLGVDSPAFDGKSFWSELQTGQIDSRPAIVENRALRNQFGWAALTGVRTNDWKWIRAPHPELYDLGADPGETRNLIDEREDQAKILARLWDSNRPAERNLEATGLTPEEERQLRSLGYLASGPVSSELSESDVDPKSVAAAIPAIEDLINARRADRALDVVASVDRVLAMDATNLFALRVKGQLLVEEGRFAEAVDVLRRVAEEADAHPEAMAYLGSAYDGAGRIQEAADWYERATTPPWIYWPALESLARLGARPSNGVAPNRVIQRLDGLTPASARESLSLARAYAILGSYSPAQRWFTRALELDDEMTEARVGLAQMLARLGEPGRALRTLEELESETVESVFVKGSLLAASGRKGEACAAFRRAIDLNPRNSNLLIGLARNLGACGEADLAVRAYEIALTLPQPSPVALFELARLEESRGDVEKARALYRRFLEVAPEAMRSQRAHAMAALGR